MRRATTLQSRPPENKIATRGEVPVAPGRTGICCTRGDNDRSSIRVSSVTGGEPSCSEGGVEVKLSLFSFGKGAL